MVSEVKDKRNSNETTTEQTRIAVCIARSKVDKTKTLCILLQDSNCTHIEIYVCKCMYILTTLNGIKIVHKLS